MAPYGLGARVRRPLKDKDYIRVGEAFLQVYGYEHPKGRIVAFPKYVRGGRASPWRSRDGSAYLRVTPFYGAYGLRYSVELTRTLKVKVDYDPVFGSIVPTVEMGDVDQAYYVEEGLGQLRGDDPLERAALELVDALRENANIGFSDIGITGSLLIGLHNPRISDIDLVIIGEESILAVKEVLSEVDIIERPRDIVMERWLMKSFSHGLSRADALKLFKRKWYRGLYKGIEVSISAVRRGVLNYGRMTYKSLGETKLLAVVTERLNPFFLPVEYGVEVLRGPEMVERVASYDGFYSDLFYPGDLIEVRGLLQKVVGKDEEYFRVAVGVLEVSDGYIRLV